jgi:Ras-related protein Rab-32
VDFALKVINWDQNTVVRLQLWDIAGQERFGNMTRVYYREAVGAFVVFDVTRVATFEAVQKWKNDIDSKVKRELSCDCQSDALGHASARR